MKQNRTSTENADVIKELADRINKGEVKDKDTLEEQKNRICQQKGCLLPSNKAIMEKLTPDAKYELFGVGDDVGDDVKDIFREAKRPDPKKPLFIGSTTEPRRARS